MSAYADILQDDRRRFYIGSTVDIQKRMEQHANRHTQTTRNMKNPVLVLSQKYDSLEIARNIERKLKKLKRKDYIEKIIAEGYIKTA